MPFQMLWIKPNSHDSISIPGLCSCCFLIVLQTFYYLQVFILIWTESPHESINSPKQLGDGNAGDHRRCCEKAKYLHLHGIPCPECVG
jgi:hypothetical protein